MLYELLSITKRLFLIDMFCKSTSCPGSWVHTKLILDNQDSPAYQRFIFSHVHQISEIRTMMPMYLAIMAKGCFFFCKSCACPGFIPS